MPAASLPVTVRASRRVGLIPAMKCPLTKRLCFRLSGGSDPRPYLLATRAITEQLMPRKMWECTPNGTKEPGGTALGVVQKRLCDVYIFSF